MKSSLALPSTAWVRQAGNSSGEGRLHCLGSVPGVWLEAAAYFGLSDRPRGVYKGPESQGPQGFGRCRESQKFKVMKIF